MPTHSPTDLLAISARAVRNGLIAAESVALTGGVPDDDGVAWVDRVDRIERAAFTHRGVQVLARASSFVGLVDAVAERDRAGLDADGFLIEVHDPQHRIEQTAAECAIALANVISAGPDLGQPRHRFVVVATDTDLLFTETVARADADYRRHDDKPWTTSSSLDARFSRALVNLVPDARSILDPCCGAGSIVLEAASLGIDAYGVDWKPALVGMTRENLAHFGYDAHVERADSRTHMQSADAIVTDLPYGNAINSDEAEIRSILEQCATLAPYGVFVAAADITPWLHTAGYADVEIHTAVKRRGFTRWIHISRTSRRPRVTNGVRPQT